MSNWQNVGARNDSTGSDIPTKAALKALIAERPQDVYLYSTDAFGPNRAKAWGADNLETGIKYSVAGPNPYTSRKWFATVEKTAKGIKVS